MPNSNFSVDGINSALKEITVALSTDEGLRNGGRFGILIKQGEEHDIFGTQYAGTDIRRPLKWSLSTLGEGGPKDGGYIVYLTLQQNENLTPAIDIDGVLTWLKDNKKLKLYAMKSSLPEKIKRGLIELGLLSAKISREYYFRMNVK